MASSAPLRDIDERFLRCSMCSKQLKEPKLLPCLHRYCRDCLKETVKEQDKAIECPMCREYHELPEGGVDALKTDFNTKNIIEFIQLNDSVRHEPLRVCINCSKELKVAAFCFRCDDFLCQGCYEHHITSKIVQDHRPHIFSLSEAEARNLTMEKLSSLREAPKCQTHPEKRSELCCTTCGNLPVCVPCSYGAHRGHDLQEVTSLAKVERAKLTEKFQDLLKYEEKLHQRREEIGNASEKLLSAVIEKGKNLQHDFDNGENKLKTKIRKTQEHHKERKSQLEERSKRNASLRKQELEDQMKDAQAKYDQVCEQERKEAVAELHRLQEDYEKEKARLEENLGIMNTKIKQLLTSLKSQEEENIRRIKELNGGFDYAMERFENLTKTARGILAAKHDWTDVLSIPNVCLAIDPLIEEVQRVLSESELLPTITVGWLSSIDLGLGRSVNISEKEESIINIAGTSTGLDWITGGITSNNDGSITLTSILPDHTQSQITVINMKGEKMQQKILTSNQDIQFRYCDFLSPFHIATVCGYDEIGLFNVTNGAYKKISIKDYISNWPADRRLRSVATDPVNNHMIVGHDDASCKEVYVFDDQLHYVYTITLPKIVTWPREMTVHEGNLIVCDYNRKQAYVVTMKNDQNEIVSELPQPDDEGEDWKPRSVCTDKESFIYMLWETGLHGRTILVQYNRDGSKILTTRMVNKSHYVAYIATTETAQGEKILLPSEHSGKIIMYGLMKETMYYTLCRIYP